MAFGTDDYTGNTYSPVPAGKYKLALVKAERKAARKEGNYYLNCQFIIVKGEYKKRTVFHMFNLENTTEQAQEIGRNQLKEMMMACGVKSLKDMWSVDKLLNKPFDAVIGIEKSDEYGDRNKINRFVFDKEEMPDDPMPDTVDEDPFDDEPKKKKKKKKKKKDKSDDVPF